MSLLAPILDTVSKIKKGDFSLRIGDYLSSVKPGKNGQYLPLDGGRYLRAAYPKIEDNFKDAPRTVTVDTLSFDYTSYGSGSGTNTDRDRFIRQMYAKSMVEYFCANATTQIWNNRVTDSPAVRSFEVSTDGFKTRTTVKVDRTFLGLGSGDINLNIIRITCRLGYFYLSVTVSLTDHRVYRSPDGINWTRISLPATVNNDLYLAEYVDVECDDKGNLVMTRFEFIPGVSHELILYISNNNFETFTRKQTGIRLGGAQLSQYPRKDASYYNFPPILSLRYIGGQWIGIVMGPMLDPGLSRLFILDDDFNTVLDNTSKPANINGLTRDSSWSSVLKSSYLPYISFGFRYNTKVTDIIDIKGSTVDVGIFTGRYYNSSTPQDTALYEYTWYNKVDKKFETTLTSDRNSPFIGPTNPKGNGSSYYPPSNLYRDIDWFSAGISSTSDNINLNIYTATRISKNGIYSRYLNTTSTNLVTYKVGEIPFVSSPGSGRDSVYYDGITFTVIIADTCSIPVDKQPSNFPKDQTTCVYLCVARLQVNDNADQFELPATTSSVGMSIASGVITSANSIVSGIRDYIRGR